MRLVLLLLLLAPGLCLAQSTTDVYLMAMPTQAADDTAMDARNLTSRAGYDNQPAFLPDGRRLVYTSIRGDADADVYLADLAAGSLRRVTHTWEGEYSPTPMPGTDSLSVVRTEGEVDGVMVQRLWRVALDGSGMALLLPDVNPVGYHAWIDRHTLALFVLGEPATLQIADLRTGAVRTIASDIGRALHKVPGRRAVSFVQKTPDGRWLLQAYDVSTGTVETIAPTRPGREDYAWTPDGAVLMGDGAMLYRLAPGAATWRPLADFSAGGIADITRLAVSPDGKLLALVGGAAE